MKNRPIGLLDSGVGGLTVLKEAMRQLPNESFLYVGDTKRCPYGPRPKEEVIAFTWDMAQYLVEKGIKMLVIACNTATAVALKPIQERLSIPVIGVVQPGSLAAIKVTENKKIGVIATQGTVKSTVYKETIQKKDPFVEVSSLACPSFVTLVEDNKHGTPEAVEEVNEVLKDFKEQELDTLILGCTHFPLLRTLIQETMGEGVTLIDSGAETIEFMSTILDYEGLNAPPGTSPLEPQFFTTGEVAPFKAIASQWLHRDDLDVKHIEFD